MKSKLTGYKNMNRLILRLLFLLYLLPLFFIIKGHRPDIVFGEKISPTTTVTRWGRYGQGQGVLIANIDDSRPEFSEVIKNYNENSGSFKAEVIFKHSSRKVDVVLKKSAIFSARPITLGEHIVVWPNLNIRAVQADGIFYVVYILWLLVLFAVAFVLYILYRGKTKLSKRLGDFITKTPVRMYASLWVVVLGPIVMNILLF